MSIFKINQQLTCRAIGDHNIVYTANVIKRTAKTVTIKDKYSAEKRCKIHTTDGGEFIFPDGRYSMCPVFRA